MKDEALKLADELDLIAGMIAIGDRIKWGQDSELMENGSTMIRRLVEELDKQSEPVACKHGVDDGACKECYKETTTPQTKPLSDEEIVEKLADLEHQQWMAWADSIMKSEKISDNRFARWASLMIPYSELSEEMKEHDRVWARKVLREIEERHGIK